MTDAALLAAIIANPDAKALADLGNDSGCAVAISATLPPIPAPIPTANLLIWAASRGVLSAVIAGTTNASPAVASACLAVQSALNGGATSLDITNPIIVGTSSVAGLLDGLTEAGILPANADTTGTNPTPGSKADLVAFGSVPQAITHGQVSDALLSSRPGGIIGA